MKKFSLLLAALLVSSHAFAAPLDCNALADTAISAANAKHDHVPLSNILDTIRAGAPDDEVSVMIAQAKDIYTNPYYAGVSPERIGRSYYSTCIEYGGKP